MPAERILLREQYLLKRVDFELTNNIAGFEITGD